MGPLDRYGLDYGWSSAWYGDVSKQSSWREDIVSLLQPEAYVESKTGSSKNNDTVHRHFHYE